MNKKQIIRTAIFLVLVLFLGVFLCDLFERRNSHITARFNTYKAQERGAVDAVYLGSSAVDRYWIAAKAYEDYGMTVYPLSVDNQPSWLMLNLAREALKTQSPELLVVDVRSFTWDTDTNPSRMEPMSRYLIDGLDFFSLNRFSVINRSLKATHTLHPSMYPRFDISYVFQFVRYHDMWQESTFSFSQLERNKSLYLGYFTDSDIAKTAPQEFSPATEERRALETYNEAYLREFLDYLEGVGAQALFVSSPYAADRENLEKLNAIGDIITEAGYPYLNFNTAELRQACTVDPESDFYNDGHVNYWGAVKYTDFLAAYLDENYQLPDHSDDPRCESWNGIYNRVIKRIDSLTAAQQSD